jgi:hypothetical protein
VLPIRPQIQRTEPDGSIQVLERCFRIAHICVQISTHRPCLNGVGIESKGTIDQSGRLGEVAAGQAYDKRRDNQHLGVVWRQPNGALSHPHISIHFRGRRKPEVLRVNAPLSSSKPGESEGVIRVELDCMLQQTA